MYFQFNKNGDNLVQSQFQQHTQTETFHNYNIIQILQQILI